jgi:PAS domain S-box-containing protein
MYQRLATQIREQLNSLADQYEGRLRTVPGYANLPEAMRRELEQQVLRLIAECLEANDERRLTQYIRERAEQVLARGFEPEWFQQAVIIPQDLITPLLQTVEESNFVWGALGRSQTTVWEIVARERRRLELQAQESLARRDIQVRTSTEVAQEIASATDLNELFRRVVTLIKERFDYYHTQLFRFEPAQDAVVLITGYGDVGQQMLAAGHKLPLRQGIVGTAAATGRSILTTDVTQSTDWRPNPYLPDTRGELAVPIKLRDQVLGILDIQADRAGALTEDDRLLLEGLCGQIAIAMESKRLIDSAHQSERLMRTIIEAVPDNLYVKTRQSEFILANKAVLKQLHCQSIEELAGKTDFDFYPRAMAEKFYKDEQALFEFGRPLINIEEPSLDAQGRPAWRLTTKVFFYNEAGEIEGLVGLGRNITERKRDEEALAEERNRLRTLIDSLPHYVYVKDRESRFVINNAAHLRILGAPSQEEVVGKRDFDYFPQEIAAKYYADEQELMNVGQPLINREEIVVDPVTGRKSWALATKVPLFDRQGTVTGFVGFTQDITERKLSEQRMEEALHEAERLYAAVSHEGWQAYRQTGSLGEGYMFDNASIQPAEHVWEPEIAQALERRALVTSRSEQRAVAVTPLTVRGEAIGALGVYDDPAHPLSQEDLELIETVAEQVALALESARLFDQTQRDAERERTINRVTTRIRNARSVDEVLSIAAQELRLSTRAARSVVEIVPATDQPFQSGNGEGVKA